MNDLYLKYKFTDRGGKHVFDVYEAHHEEDIAWGVSGHVIEEEPVGEVRMEPEWLDAVTMPERGEASNDDDTG